MAERVVVEGEVFTTKNTKHRKATNRPIARVA
jgi:hypothetical protein